MVCGVTLLSTFKTAYFRTMSFFFGTNLKPVFFNIFKILNLESYEHLKCYLSKTFTLKVYYLTKIKILEKNKEDVTNFSVNDKNKIAIVLQ